MASPHLTTSCSDNGSPAGKNRNLVSKMVTVLFLIFSMEQKNVVLPNPLMLTSVPKSTKSSSLCSRSETPFTNGNPTIALPMHVKHSPTLEPGARSLSSSRGQLQLIRALSISKVPASEHSNDPITWSGRWMPSTIANLLVGKTSTENELEHCTLADSISDESDLNTEF